MECEHCARQWLLERCFGGGTDNSDDENDAQSDDRSQHGFRHPMEHALQDGGPVHTGLQFQFAANLNHAFGIAHRDFARLQQQGWHQSGNHTQHGAFSQLRAARWVSGAPGDGYWTDAPQDEDARDPLPPSSHSEPTAGTVLHTVVEQLAEFDRFATGAPESAMRNRIQRRVLARAQARAQEAVWTEEVVAQEAAASAQAVERSEADMMASRGWTAEELWVQIRRRPTLSNTRWGGSGPMRSDLFVLVCCCLITAADATPTDEVTAEAAGGLAVARAAAVIIGMGALAAAAAATRASRGTASMISAGLNAKRVEATEAEADEVMEAAVAVRPPIPALQADWSVMLRGDFEPEIAFAIFGHMQVISLGQLRCTFKPMRATLMRHRATQLRLVNTARAGMGHYCYHFWRTVDRERAAEKQGAEQQAVLQLHLARWRKWVTGVDLVDSLLSPGTSQTSALPPVTVSLPVTIFCR